MPLEYLRDGDVGFVGLNSRDNPAALPKGIVNKSQNMRLDRGVATVRKGLKRKTSSTILGQTIYGIGSYLDLSGQEIFVIAVTDGLYIYNPQTEVFSTKIAFPVGETITTQDGCEITTAIDKIYITRGHSKRPLIATLNTTSYVITGIIAAPTAGTGAEFPNCSGLFYYANRLIAIGQDHRLGYTPTPRSRDSVGVSNYLDFDHWDAIDVFNFAEGSNDEVVAVAPWTLNEFVVFLRNSIYYVGVGTGRYITGDGLASTAYMKNLVSDLGCVSKRSIVQADGGIIFLSDNGVYAMTPNPVGTNESMRLLTIANPLSAPIDDVIQRINRQYAYRSVGIYWNNRYYLAVPLDSSTDNNCILVYNFILKNWESVDTYPTGFDIFSFAIGKKDNQRRLYGFDTDAGIFLLEDLEYDEYGASTGTPVLPFYLPSTLSSSSFTPNQIQGELKTRLYTFESLRDKRFSTIEVDLVSNAGGQISTYAETINPDTTTLLDSFGSPLDEDSTRRLAIRKIAYGIQMRFTTNNLRTSVRATNITGTIMGKQNISKK
jgi:hypothetical protein